MSSLTEAVQTVRLVELSDGNEYAFTLIGLDIWCAFCDQINRGLERKLGHPVDLDEMMLHAMTMRGMRWLLWRSVKVQHPKVKLESIGELIGSMDRLTEIFELIADIPDKEDEPEGSDPPNPDAMDPPPG